MKRNRLTFDTNQKWREERANSVGASAVGILFGETHFLTPLALANKMREELNGIFSYDQTWAMKRGHAHEGSVAYLWEDATGLSIIKASQQEYLVRRDDIPFMHASPDRTYWIDNDGPRSDDNKGILECKNPGGFEPLAEIPASWELQLQVQMGICGYKEGYLAWEVAGCLSPDGFGYRRYEFDQEIFDAAVEVCRDFWHRCILGGEDPIPVNAADVIKLYPTSKVGKVLTADNETLDLIDQYKSYKQTEKELKILIDGTADKIKTLFTDEEAIVNIDGKTLATFKTAAPRTTIDSKKLKAEYPEAYAACSKEGKASRTLLVK